LVAFVSWWLKLTPRKIIYIGNKTAKKEFSFFSIDLLFKTLFLPWKRDEIDMSSLSLQDRFRIMIMNLVSRLVGAVVRGGTIFFGLCAIAFVYIATIVAATFIILLPIVSLYLIITGIVG
jgi:hypothetical protein